ncbi:MAG: DUF2130 domain-containing protein [Gemmatimonadaceae bacterium]
MSARRRRCPLCGTVLPEGKFQEVLREHRQLKEHEERARELAAKLKDERAAIAMQLRELKSERANLRREVAGTVREQVQRRTRAIESRAAKTTAREMRLERAAMNRREKEIKRVEAREANYKKQLKANSDRLSVITEVNRRLKEQIENGVTPQIEGLLEEKKLLAYLSQLFPDDDYSHTGKGGDIVHTLMVGSQAAGVIVYECKRCRKFQRSYILQTANAKRQRGAQYAILVTNSFPKRNTAFYVDPQRDVIVLSPAGLHPVVHTARQSLISLHRLRATDAEKDKAVRAVYSYIAGPEYGDRINAIVAEAEELAKQFREEVQSHRRAWRTRDRIYRTVFSDVAHIDATLRALMQQLDGAHLLKQLPAGTISFPPMPDLPD